MAHTPTYRKIRDRIEPTARCGGSKKRQVEIRTARTTGRGFLTHRFSPLAGADTLESNSREEHLLLASFQNLARLYGYTPDDVSHLPFGRQIALRFGKPGSKLKNAGTIPNYCYSWITANCNLQRRRKPQQGTACSTCPYARCGTGYTTNVAEAKPIYCCRFLPISIRWSEYRSATAHRISGRCTSTSKHSWKRKAGGMMTWMSTAKISRLSDPRCTPETDCSDR